MNSPSFKAVADRAVLVEFAAEIGDEVNRMVIAVDQTITNAGIEGVLEVVPALVNLLVVFDPLLTDHARIETAIRALLPVDLSTETKGTHHRIEVCYDDDLSPDLKAVADACSISEEAVINAHTSAQYRVGMYGFAPGYAYLAGVPAEIQVPRKTAPVRDIPAGSVMIAGPQCLVTTLIMPTGWSIIGHTSEKVITGDPEQPFLFDVGDTVSFARIRRDAL